MKGQEYFSGCCKNPEWPELTCAKVRNVAIPESTNTIYHQVGVAVGMATRDRVVAFCSTFAAFLARAYDHIRMAAVSRSNINFFGSHCGISIGKL